MDKRVHQNLQVIPYHITDSFAIKRRKDDQVWEENAVEWAYMHATRGPAFTLLDEENEILGCGGVMLKRKGFGEAWILFDETITKYPFDALRLTIDWLQKIEVDMDLHRTEAYVKADNVSYRRFVERLGFEREGLLRKWGPDGSDYILYARVR